MQLSKSKTLKFSISGLRGIYGQDITPENIPLFCAAFDSVLPRGPVAIAQDTRNTGVPMKQAALGSLVSLGREVIDIGILPTPTLKNYVSLKNLTGGLMISASHNPPEYNAFKFIKGQGFFFAEKENEKFLKNLKEKPIWKGHKAQGSLREDGDQALLSHIREIIQHIPLPRKIRLKVAIDTAGACATNIAEVFLKKLGVQVFSLFPQFLEKFPRRPEPTEKALGLFSSFVQKNKCDLGFAFDPDADRLALVSSSGKILGEEYTLPLAALEALNHRDGGMVVNLSSSWLNQWAADQRGRKTFRSKVGEKHVVELMKKRRSKFGGEGNGGVIDREVASQGRDSLAGMAWIIALMCRTDQTLDKIVQKMPTTYMKKITVPLKKQNFAGRLSSKILREFPGFTLNTEDGSHFSTKSGLPWLHIRASNTEPIVRITAEAMDQNNLQQFLRVCRSNIL